MREGGAVTCTVTMRAIDHSHRWCDSPQLHQKEVRGSPRRCKRLKQINGLSLFLVRIGAVTSASFQRVTQ